MNFLFPTSATVRNGDVLEQKETKERPSSASVTGLLCDLL